MLTTPFSALSNEVSAMEPPSSKKNWSKVIIPPEEADLLFMVARRNGYSRAEIHYFLFRLLKQCFPEDVETLAKYIGADWLNEKPPEE